MAWNDDVRVRSKRIGLLGWRGVELALTGPAMNHYPVRWDDGTTTYERGEDLESV